LRARLLARLPLKFRHCSAFATHRSCSKYLNVSIPASASNPRHFIFFSPSRFLFFCSWSVLAR
jgi:hypothetical protein